MTEDSALKRENISCFCKMTIKYVKYLLPTAVTMVLQYLLWLLVGGIEAFV